MPTTMRLGSRIHGCRPRHRLIVQSTLLWRFLSRLATVAGITEVLTAARSALLKSAATAQLGPTSPRPTSPHGKKKEWWRTEVTWFNAVTRSSLSLRLGSKPKTRTIVNLTLLRLQEAKVKSGFVSVGLALGDTPGKSTTSRSLTLKRTTPALTII